MTESISLTVPLIRPGLRIRVVFEHEAVLRKAFWFTYTKKGDLILASYLLRRRVWRGPRSAEEPCVGEGTEWLTADQDRDHLTLHPSLDGEPSKATSAVNGPGGLKQVGLDLRTLKTLRPLMVHRLTWPQAYPTCSNDKPSLFLGRAYVNGAPEVHFWASPVGDDGHAGKRLPPAPSGACDLLIAPEALGGRRFLIQIRLLNDHRRPFWPQHVISYPAP